MDWMAEQTLSPSCLVFYLGFSRKVAGLRHHTFFFDSDLDAHLRQVFEHHTMPDAPTFYVSATSLTDPSTAPPGGEAIFVLVPISYRLQEHDTAAVRAATLDLVLRRMDRALLRVGRVGPGAADGTQPEGAEGAKIFVQRLIGTRGQTAWGIAPPEPST